MSIATLIRRMADAGAPPEAIAIAVEAIEEAQALDATKRAKDAERKRRQRHNDRDSHGMVTGHSTDCHGTTPSPPPPPPLSPQTPQSPPPPPPHPPASASAFAHVHTREAEGAWIAVRERYWDDITAQFGIEFRPGWPHATDRITVLRWLEAGATPDLIADVTRDHLSRMAERKRGPPRSMSCFEDNITAAIAASCRPVEVDQNARPPSSSNRSAATYRNRAGTDAEHRAALAAAVAERLGTG